MLQVVRISSARGSVAAMHYALEVLNSLLLIEDLLTELLEGPGLHLLLLLLARGGGERLSLRVLGRAEAEVETMRISIEIKMERSKGSRSERTAEASETDGGRTGEATQGEDSEWVSASTRRVLAGRREDGGGKTR